MGALSGTVKQIEWASQVRTKTHAELDRVFGYCRKRVRNEWDLSDDRVESIYGKMTAELDKATNAAWWIAYRDRILDEVANSSGVYDEYDHILACFTMHRQVEYMDKCRNESSHDSNNEK